jgi:hypothetical protein
VRSDADATDEETPVDPDIRRFCGTYVVEVNQRCASLDDGRCRP